MACHSRPQCDSYFVESHDDRARACREDLRERERLMKRQTQIAIAQELSDLTSAEYREDILQHMEQMELETMPDVASIEIQTEIKWFMRPYLLDFLLEAHTAFALLPETLFLTINLLDRYCSKRIVYKRHYQLVGAAALLIAAKYGDRKERVPTIKELRCMCCALYDDDMFTQMEWHVLQTLEWNIGHPTIDSFLQLALEGLPYEPEVEHLACYISEIALFHKKFISKRSSDLARASLALARVILNRPQPLNTEWAANYESHTLVDLSQHLHGPSEILARKYSSAHLSQASRLLEQFLQRQAISRCYATPPTPPYEKLTHQQETCPVTPTKRPYYSSGPDGCLTPPITPTNDVYFGNNNQQCYGGHRPPTPLSMGTQPSTAHCSDSYQLPPLSHLSSTG
ncbi:MAG: hypothetical protein LQ351_000097 [Letrouitia transgressa]|nr:MAG: hypothetical protein LQ351_000097 [Letrouitia transgressa]